MRKGSRSIQRLCACGCGEFVPPSIDKTTGRVMRYPKFIPTHGHKDWGKRWAARLETIQHPREKPLGSKQIRSDGYIRVKTIDGWIYEHRHVVNASSNVIVHHKDGNPRNNHPSNLEQMSVAAHNQTHFCLPTNQWSKKYECCQECQTTSRKHAAKGLCTRCFQKAQAALKERWP